MLQFIKLQLLQHSSSPSLNLSTPSLLPCPLGPPSSFAATAERLPIPDSVGSKSRKLLGDSLQVEEESSSEDEEPASKKKKVGRGRENDRKTQHTRWATYTDKPGWQDHKYLPKEWPKAWQCSLCHQRFKWTTTQNFLSHVGPCKESRGTQSHLSANGAVLPPATKGELDTCLVHFIADLGLPFSIVEHESTKKLFALLQKSVSNYYPPTAKAMALRIVQQAKQGDEKLDEILSGIDSLVSINHGGWTPPSFADHYLGVMVMFYDKHWIRHELMLALQVCPDQAGLGIAKQLFNILKAKKLCNKIGSGCADNASVNTRAANFLEKHLREEHRLSTVGGTLGGFTEAGPQFEASFQGGCMCHQLNLFCQDLLAAWSKVDPANHVDFWDTFQPFVTDVDADERVEEEVEALGEQEISPETSDTDSLLDYVRWLVKNIMHSSTRRKLYESLELTMEDIRRLQAETSGSDPESDSFLQKSIDEMKNWADAGKAGKVLLPTRDVRTRWNSTYDMLVRLRRIRPRLDLFCRHTSVSARIITDMEWRAINKLIKALDVFKRFTEYFSKGNQATIQAVFLAYLRSRDALSAMVPHFATPRGDNPISAIIKKLDEYCLKALRNKFLLSAVVLSPGFYGSASQIEMFERLDNVIASASDPKPSQLLFDADRWLREWCNTIKEGDSIPQQDLNPKDSQDSFMSDLDVSFGFTRNGRGR